MPLAFRLPTTSHLAFDSFLNSDTHPSLAQSATSQRGVVRQSLKRHKRLPEGSKASHLNETLAALNAYVPYLLALDSGLSGNEVCGDEVQVNLESEATVEWRATLTATLPGREPPRVKLQHFEYELLFSLSTLAATHYLIARGHLHALYGQLPQSSEARISAISAARKHFIEAGSIFAFLSRRANQLSSPPPVADISPSTLEALSSLCLAEATLAAILKDDPYPSVVVQDRNPNDKDWMIKAPEVPKVRALLFARLCMAASDHASKASAALSGSRGVTSDLSKYMEDLKKTARGKACRFLAIDAEISGMTGEAIAWLRAANKELGITKVSGDDQAKSKMLSKLRKDWSEKREDRKVEKGIDWGSDGGRFEEARVVEMLMAKWTKINDTINVQTIPASEPLHARLPSGREFDTPSPWIPPALEESVLSQMRAPPDAVVSRDEPIEDDSDEAQGQPSDPVGAFPGTGSAYSKTTSYY